MKGPLLKDFNLFPERIFYNCQRYYYNIKISDQRIIYSPFHAGYMDLIINQKCFWGLVNQGIIEIL